MSTVKRVLTVIAIAVFTTTSLSACNTIEGAGEDIEVGGEAIQDAADEE